MASKDKKTDEKKAAASKPRLFLNRELSWLEFNLRVLQEAADTSVPLLERLEGFCTEKDWQRAYNEINEFERQLTDWGAVVLKFWIHIDQDTQLQRFNDRQNTPEKQWKLTEEDWRNREKWPQYEEAIDEMLQKTSTENAPWFIIESNDKKFARIRALRIVIDALEKACEAHI